MALKPKKYYTNVRSAHGSYLKLEKVRDIKFLKKYYVLGNSSSFSMPHNQEKKQIPRYEVRFTNKNHPFMWLVCKTRAKILLFDPETSLTTPRLLPLRRLRRSYGNYQSSQSSGSSRNILKWLGRSGRSYGNQAVANPRAAVASHACILKASSRVLSPRGEVTRDGALKTSLRLGLPQISGSSCNWEECVKLYFKWH